MIDWGLGQYERTAAELEPVAEHAVTVADPRPGERVLDVATGTGNAALLAARRRATVTGLDASARLIDVAQQRSADIGSEITLLVGDMQALPFDDASFDVALSIFGLIFAADAQSAFGEMMRVLKPGGRAVLSVWVPAGTIDAMVGVFARAMAEVTGSSPPRFPWHDHAAMTELASRYAADVQFHDGELEIVADSPEAYLRANQEHPMSVAARPVLERAGTASATTAKALEILRTGNQDPSRFRVTSPYRLIEVLLPPSIAQ